MCYIRNHGNYYSWAKEEVFSNDPRISIVHDVISDNEANKIKEMATPQVRFHDTIFFVNNSPKIWYHF